MNRRNNPIAVVALAALRREDAFRCAVPRAGRPRKTKMPDARREKHRSAEGSQNALKHGRYTATAIHERRGAREIIRQLRKLIAGRRYRTRGREAEFARRRLRWRNRGRGRRLPPA